jgi:hypothetical protein
MATKMRSARRSKQGAPSIVKTEPTQQLDLFSYDMIEDVGKREALRGYESEVKGLIKQTLENVVKIGGIFYTVKEEILDTHQWRPWVESCFGDELHVSTTHNWINVYKLYKEYGEKYPDALEQISLKTLYTLGRSGVDDEEREVAFELIEAKEVSPKSARQVVETYRKLKLVNAGIEPEVVKMLTKVDVAENQKYVTELRKLSKNKRQEVAQVLASREAESPKEAMRLIKERNAPAPQEPTAAIDVDFSASKRSYSSLEDVEAESIQIALVESPLKYDFMETNFFQLTKDISRVLQPGGFAMITVGHKAAMFAGNHMTDDLKPVHLLCFRRTPGNSATIMGLNITSASVFLVLAYKPPYRAPRGSVLADLHTLTDTEAMTGFDVVQSGLEKSFDYILEPLMSARDDDAPMPAVLHHIVQGSQHFSIRDHLEESSIRMGAREFVAVG